MGSHFIISDHGHLSHYKNWQTATLSTHLRKNLVKLILQLLGSREMSHLRRKSISITKTPRAKAFEPAEK